MRRCVGSKHFTVIVPLFPQEINRYQEIVRATWQNAWEEGKPANDLYPFLESGYTFYMYSEWQFKDSQI